MLDTIPQEIADLDEYMTLVGQQARAASYEIAKATTAQKNKALTAIADVIDKNRDTLLEANALDLEEWVCTSFGFDDVKPVGSVVDVDVDVKMVIGTEVGCDE